MRKFTHGKTVVRYLACSAAVFLPASIAMAQQGIDVVLKIDESGSFGDDIADVQANVVTIFNALPAGSHVGVVGYGHSGFSSHLFAAPHVHGVLTDDQTAFQNAVNQLDANGGTEPGYDAIVGSADDTLTDGNGTSVSLGFRGAPYCNILFTDEPSNGDVNSQQDAIDAMTAVGGFFFGVTTASANASFAPIATATGGAMFSLEAFRMDPTPVIQAVLAACVSAVQGTIDIKPQSCPNPLNTRSRGVIPVAILGSDSLDVNDIDPTTVMLEDVPALRTSIEDVATPFEGTKDDAFDCTTAGPDGFDDLVAHFDNQDIVAMLNNPSVGDEIELTVKFELFDGTEITGTDFVIVRQ